MFRVRGRERVWLIVRVTVWLRFMVWGSVKVMAMFMVSFRVRCYGLRLGVMS